MASAIPATAPLGFALVILLTASMVSAPAMLATKVLAGGDGDIGDSVVGDGVLTMASLELAS